MKNFTQQIQDIKDQNYELDFSDTLSQAFDNFKKTSLIQGAILFLLMIMIFMLLMGITGIIMGVGLTTDFFTNLQAAQLQESNTSIILQLIINVLATSAIAPLSAGMIKIAHNAEIQKPFGFSTAFEYYKSTYLKDLCLSMLYISLVTASINSISKILMTGGNTGYEVFLFPILVLLNIMIPLLTFLSAPLIIFANQNATNAIKISIFLVLKKFWTILLLLFLGCVLASLGIIMLCIGLFFTIPILYSMQYIIFRNAIQIDEISEIDQIGSSE